MKKINPLLSIFLLSELVLYPFSPQAQGFSESGGALVGEDSLSVYSANSSKSDIVKVLNKGEHVWIQIEISGAEDKWCLISMKGKHEPLGFVPCKGLNYLDQGPHKYQLTEGGIYQPILRDDAEAQPAGSESQGITPYSSQLGSLLQAVWREDVSAIKELLGQGVNPNAKTIMGGSPLHGAAKKNEAEITSMLIAYGADVNAKDVTGLSPLMAAASIGQTQNMEILLAAGAHINAKDDKGFTALMWAVVQGSLKGVEVLLENKADVNARSAEGRTAFWLSKQLLSNTRKSLANAYRKNSEELIKELRAKLANHEEISQMLKDSGGKE